MFTVVIMIAFIISSYLTTKRHRLLSIKNIVLYLSKRQMDGEREQIGPFIVLHSFHKFIITCLSLTCFSECLIINYIKTNSYTLKLDIHTL